ncbi:Adenosine deaminase [Lamellibrachia satsuma]|nr:Adenosine deaminase [Lamellibrachia satsuma]
MLPRSKVELHVHLDGSFRPETIFELAREKNMNLKVSSAEELKKSLCISLNCVVDLPTFLNKFTTMTAPIIGDLKAIRRVTYEFCEDIASQGIVYCEPRYCPQLLTSSGDNESSGRQAVTARDVVIVITKVFAEAEKKFNIKFGSILCCMRNAPDMSKEVLELCTEFCNKGVIGIDLAGLETETDPTPQEIISVFKEAHSRGINITVHAGENGGAPNVAEAVDKLYARRVGHGYHVLDDEGLYERMRQSRIHFEVCPCSSVITGSVPLKDHPLLRFIADGVDYSISSDDPTITGGGLSQDLSFVIGHLGMTQQHVFQANLNAARASFLPATEKETLVRRLLEEYIADGYLLET